MERGERKKEGMEERKEEMVLGLGLLTVSFYSNHHPPHPVNFPLNSCCLSLMYTILFYLFTLLFFLLQCYL